jgi:hypothetical protein
MVTFVGVALPRPDLALSGLGWCLLAGARGQAFAGQATVCQRLADIKDTFVLVVNPPSVQGLGSAGGFKLMVQDRNNLGPQVLADAANR